MADAGGSDKVGTIRMGDGRWEMVGGWGDFYGLLTVNGQLWFSILISIAIGISMAWGVTWFGG